MRSAGYAAETFASAKEFLAWLPKGQAACLLLDIQKNDMSAFELQEKLAVPVVFITANDDALIRERIETSGAAALKKPFAAQTVLDAIQRAVARDRDGHHDRDRDGAHMQSDRPL